MQVPFKSLIRSVVRFLKNEADYKIESDYSFKEWLFIILHRCFQILRGLKFKFIHRGVSGVVFCGSSITVEHGYNFRAETGLIIENDVYINALSIHGISFGRNVTVGKSSVIICTGVIARKGTGLKIGNYSAIGAQSFIGAQGGITIGNDVIMGPGVRIFSENHIYENKEILIRKQGETRSEVIIGDNCWIGAGTTILSGVTIGKGCLIGAGSVVTTSIDEYSVAVGVPAKIIKKRN